MNLGGPDTLDAVRPFLKNLFSDPAIITLPWPLRALLAWFISRVRTKKARKIYQQMGGGSPLLANTRAQQILLRDRLRDQLPHKKVDVFIAMRYWHPFTSEAVSLTKSFQPDQIILLPLYPQYSTTTTGSSFLEWHKSAKENGLNASTWEIRCYPQDEGFIHAHVDLLLPWIDKATVHGKPRILFSAHGLPQKVIDAGDPYEVQIHETVSAIMKQVPSGVEHVVCYQSKVGPMKWLEPSLEQEVIRAGKEKVPVIVVPVSFVSEHSETLVELDRDYRTLAESLGVPFYGRVPTLSDHPSYIQALAGLVSRELNQK
jgi:ferrochelatase